jgi:hypothetical protein
MSKQLIQTIRPHVNLMRDPATGLAWVEDGTSGTGSSCHPNIAGRGRSRYWTKTDRTVYSHGFTYNIDQTVGHDELTDIARAACQCGGQH